MHARLRLRFALQSWRSSELAKQQQNENHDHDRADDAGRPVTPARAVAPVRDDTEQQQDENYEQKGTERHDAFLAKSLTVNRSRLRFLKPAGQTTVPDFS